MQNPFRHPLATHSALDVLGYRRNGSPIYAIAGGSNEDEGGSGSDGNGGDGGQGGTSEGGPSGGNQGAAGGTGEGGGTTDWEAKYRETLGHSREWERRAKANSAAVDELATLKQSQMSEQEKAVDAARAEGRTAAATEYGRELAAARFEAAAAKAGVQLGEAAGLIDMARFVGQDGKPDNNAIKTAVDQLAKLAPAKGPGRSGGDLGGGSGDQAPTLDQQIAQAQADGNWRLVMQLQNSKLPGIAAAQQQ
ncbi:hypothetical protein ACWDWT_00465 [Streptomyces sp. NPDC003343]